MLILRGFSSTTITLIPGVWESIDHTLITTAGFAGDVWATGLSGDTTVPTSCADDRVGQRVLTSVALDVFTELRQAGRFTRTLWSVATTRQPRHW